MKHTKLLDCTLRDGAYVVNKTFGDSTIHGIVSGLMQSKIDYIEIGFFQDDEYGEGKTVFKNSADAKRFIPSDKQGCRFTVLADFSRYSLENLDQCTQDSVDAVRECFFKHERFDAIQACKEIKEKGYELFVQPVDILGYTDAELIDFIEKINLIEPDCFSIVDTFGSMYQEDLHRVFQLINHNLVPTCKIGFHSHNNMQLSNALSQEFMRISLNQREVVVDTTLAGMGRGAGNTPTELMAQYMTSHWNYSYDIDALLDLMDEYMNHIRSQCDWGYSTPYFIAGGYSAHVNNIAYLTKKNSIRSKDIRYILNKIGAVARKKYDYDLLEKTYCEYFNGDIDDTKTLALLQQELEGKEVLIVAPGYTAKSMKDEIKKYQQTNQPVVISINFLLKEINADYIYLSNVKRFDVLKNEPEFQRQAKILASNLGVQSQSEKEYIVSFTKLIKCGWNHVDNSLLMLLRLLDMLQVQKISIAGFDGYSYAKEGQGNYAIPELELATVQQNPSVLNEEIAKMLEDYLCTRKTAATMQCITPSRFASILERT